MVNNKNDIKNIIDSRLSALTVSQELEHKIVSKVRNRKRAIGKPLTVAAAICLMIFVPAMAAKISTFNSLLYRISPQTAQLLQPIELLSESNGIKMEVVAAMNDDETAIVYLTLQDLSGGNRVDKTVDLYNYSIRDANMFTHELVDYNENTKTATIRMVANGGKELNGKKITVRVDSFLSGKESFENVDTGLVLSDIVSKTAKTVPLNMNKIPGGGGDLFGALKEKGTIDILKTDEASINLPGIDFVQISNIGYVDGRFHVQTKWNESIDDHGFLYIVSSTGDRINPTNIYFGVDENGNTKYGSNYIEYIFEVGPTEISDYSLYGYFVKSHRYVEGEWQTTFKIESVDKAKKVAGDVDLGHIKIDKITITPIGVNITHNTKISDELNINITMNDGTALSYNHAVVRRTNGKTNMKYMLCRPIKVDNIKEVRINGRVVAFD